MTHLLLILLFVVGSTSRADRVESSPRQDIPIYGSTSPIVYFMVSDCDGDGWEEFLAWGWPQPGTTDVLQWWVHEKGWFRVYEQCNIQHGRIGNCGGWDLEGDGRPETVVARLDDTAAWLEIYHLPQLDPVRTSEVIALPDRDGSGGWDGNFLVEACSDLDGDGIRDIICSLEGGYDILPRRVSVFSGLTLEEIASYPTAGGVYKIKVCEQPEAPQPIILVATPAPGNRHQVGSFSDHEMYLCALNRECQLLWYVRTAPKGGLWDFDITDADGDGIVDVAVSLQEERGSDAIDNRIEIRDLMTGEVKRYRSLPADVNSMLAADLDRDTRPELILALAGGTTYIMNTELEPAATRIDDATAYLFGAEDLDLDGDLEIIARCGNARLTLLNSNLGVLAARDFGSQIRQAYRCRVESNLALLLVSLEDGKELKYLRYHTGLLDILPKNLSGWRLFTVISVTVAVATLIGIGIGLWIAKRPKPVKTARSATTEIFASAVGFGHGSSTERTNLERLQQYSESVPEPGDPRYHEHMRRLASIMRTYKELTRGALEEIARCCARADGYAEIATKLQAHTDALNDVVAAARGDLVSELDGEHYRMLAELAREVRSTVLSVRERLFEDLQTDVPAVICSLLSAIRARLLDMGVVEIVTRFEGDSVAHVEEQPLKECLEVLLVNAAEAMKGCSLARLELETTRAKYQVVIRVRDTGHGIPRTDWQRVFERDYSTKGDDRGLGLYQAREILLRYEGRIRVETSSPNEGTVMVVNLKAPAPDFEDGSDSERTLPADGRLEALR